MSISRCKVTKNYVCINMFYHVFLDATFFNFNFEKLFTSHATIIDIIKRIQLAIEIFDKLKNFSC